MKFVVSAVAFSLFFVGTLLFLQPEQLEIEIQVATDSAESLADHPTDLEPKTDLQTRASKTRRKQKRANDDRELEAFMDSINGNGSSSARPEKSNGQYDSKGQLGPPKGLLNSKESAPSLQVGHWKNSYPLSIGALRGKIVVLDFWATWCGPCIRSIPLNNEIHANFRNQGVVILGVCATKGGSEMKNVAREEAINYPIAIDIDDRSNEAYDISKFPTYCIIDRKGNLRYADCSRRDLKSAIEYLLSE